MTLALSSQAFSLTGPTRTIAIGLDIGIRFVKGMAMFAVCLGSHLCCMYASRFRGLKRDKTTGDIDTVSNGFQVGQVTAGMMAAEMIQFKTGSKRAVMQFPQDQMSTPCMFLDVDTAIARSGNGSSPWPTGIWPARRVNMLHQPVKQRSCIARAYRDVSHDIAMQALSCIVSWAKPMAKMTTIAQRDGTQAHSIFSRRSPIEECTATNSGSWLVGMHALAVQRIIAWLI